MKRLLERLITIPLWTLFIIPIAIANLLFFRGVDGPSTVLAVTMGTVLIVGLLALMANLAGLDPQSAEIAGDVSRSELERGLLERWLRRSRHYRYVGGVVGFILGIGFANNGGLTEACLGLFGGIALGGALAELHVLRKRPPSTRSADLTRRRVIDYASRTDLVVMAAVAIAACAIAVAAIVGTSPTNSRSLFLSIIALTIVVATIGLQHLVTTRPRPAVSEELRQADDLLRHLAATQGFARPAIAVALMTLAFAIADLGTDGLLDVVAFGVGLAGVVWYVRSRQTTIVDIARRSQAAAA